MRLLKFILKATSFTALGSLITIVVLYSYYLDGRPDLKPWHTVELGEEFTVSKTQDVQTFGDYLQLEDRLFQQLKKEVYAKTSSADQLTLNRYSSESRADPTSYQRNWNRSFEMKAESPRGGVLLLHGLSDSPYSMRALAEIFHAHDYWVVSLRLPGHGTIPAGLVSARWQDWAAAMRLAARHVRQKIGENRPFLIAGYSTGSALAVEYSLAVLEGENYPVPKGIILLSPAIGVSPIAVLAKYQAVLARFEGMEKLAWDPILPEYDPYKYQSFAVNSGDQIYRLTLAIEERINRLDQGNGVKGFPRVLAFQSVVDATVSPSALVKGLFQRLADEGHELVLFDIDRHAENKPFLARDPGEELATLLATPDSPFSISLLTNISPDTNKIHIRYRPVRSSEISDEQVDLFWPRGIYSLAHVALPFSPGDPIYGEQAPKDKKKVYLGRIELRGEKGLLVVSASEFSRLRYNPFFNYMKQRIEEFIEVQ